MNSSVKHSLSFMVTYQFFILRTNGLTFTLSLNTSRNNRCCLGSCFPCCPSPRTFSGVGDLSKKVEGKNNPCAGFDITKNFFFFYLHLSGK